MVETKVKLFFEQGKSPLQPKGGEKLALVDELLFDQRSCKGKGEEEKGEKLTKNRSLENVRDTKK